ncbi:unnamed protein product [Echinostoma caproni]|uniref:Rab-GAP TBC domain-containing protein n=1 Tax=Echinostoma caproni TaxID=27848 RepID=A0A183B944_9TREM|nr:unnamed protein product [Echinostoma caproni]
MYLRFSFRKVVLPYIAIYSRLINLMEFLDRKELSQFVCLSDDVDSSEFGPTTDADSSTSELAGYELSDQLLLPVFFLSEAGQKRLRDILHQVARGHPELVYVPQLWPLLALFLHYHSAPIARACLLGLLRQSDLITQTKAAWIVHSLALERLGLQGFASKEAKQMTKHKMELNPNEVRISLGRWPVALWHLPLGYLVRLVDCFLLEGPKVFFRAGLLVSVFNFNGAKTKSWKLP